MLYDIYHLGYLNAGQRLTIKTNQIVRLIFIDNFNLPKYLENSLSFLAYDALQITFSAAYRIPYDNIWHIIVEIGSLPTLTGAIIEINNVMPL